MQPYEDSDFSQPSGSSLYGEKMIFEKGRSYRIGFPYLREGTEDVLIRHVRYFPYNQDIFRRKILVPDDKELFDVLQNLLGTPWVRAVTPIIVYRTDSQANIVKEGGFHWEVIPFVFDLKKKKEALRQLNEMHGLGKIDLKVYCQEQKYQDLLFTAYNQCIWRDLSVQNATFKASLAEAVNGCAASMHEAVAASIGKDMLRRMVNEHLGVDSGGGSGSYSAGGKPPETFIASPSGDVNVEDLLVQ